MPKKYRILIFACAAVYIAAYVGRLSYSASMVGILNATGATKADAGLVTTFFYVTYGCGQLINAFLCRYYKPRPVIAGVLIVSALSNLLIFLIRDVTVVKFVWLVNGAVQSMLWCTLIELLSRRLPKEHMAKATVAMSATAAVGTTLAYGISALCVALDCWPLTFFVAAAFLLLAGGVWIFVMTQVERARAGGALEEDDTPVRSVPESGTPVRKSRAFLWALVLIGATAIANGFIKDGVNNWLPKLLHDEFGVADSLSIILTLLLPVFSVFGAVFARRVYLKLQNHLRINGIFYTTAFVLALGVYLFYPMRSTLLTMGFFIGLACMMAAINNVITSMVPLDNRDKMDSGLLAGLLDTLCYVGSTAAGTLLGVLSQSWGWDSVLITLTVLAGVAALLSISFSFIRKREKG